MRNIKGIDSREKLLLALLSAISIGVYLVVSYLTFRIGYPLDDAWIHQTYARNLGQNGEWAFISGQSSAGSTAPLWTALLGIGYAFSLNEYIWTFFIGWVLLLMMALLGSYTFRLLSPTNGNWAFGAGVLIIFEWHLVWAATSGMETLLFSLLMLLVLVMLFADRVNWILVGFITGLSIWVRPDGLTILGPVFFVLLLGKSSWPNKLRKGIFLVFGVSMLFIPYLIFNNATSGMWWPNTFYAKQAEYAIELNDPLWFRIYEQVQLPLIGVGILLVPGFFCTVLDIYRRRHWPAIGGCLWAIGYLLIYALRLPVTYQHGRYIIPMIPIFLLWSFAGVRSLSQPRSAHLWRRVVSEAWLYSIVLVLLGFWVLGARAYGRDVALIESEMVKSAHWLAENTDEDSIIAAHDIGALGYFSNRMLVDLAGLVSPEVIPFIRDEERLAKYLDKRGADYLVTFPGWYPELVKKSTLLYQTGEVYSPAQGGENMAIYKWNKVEVTP
jgi:hypothetical protein